MASFIKSLYVFSKDIKLSHSIFALPFVASGFLLSNIPSITTIQLILIVCCMISARSFAMGMNRYLDRFIDAKNPRTNKRHLPNGTLKPFESLSWSLFFATCFLICAFTFNFSVGVMGFLILLILGSYSLTKRFTWASHFYLGACLGLSPVATEFALIQRISPTLCLLFLAITCWTAGFDIIYATQDIDFDRQNKLKSIPAVFGLKKSILISRFLFCLMMLFLILIDILSSRGVFYRIGLVIIGSLLIYEQYLIKNLKRNQKAINYIFFNLNAYVSVIFYIFTHVDYIFSKV